MITTQASDISVFVLLLEEAYNESVRQQSQVPLEVFWRDYTERTEEKTKIFAQKWNLLQAHLYVAKTFFKAGPDRDLIEKKKNSIDEAFKKFSDKYHDNETKPSDDEYLTNVQIGPLTFNWSVQSININEQKNIEEISGIRRQGSFLIPEGQSKPFININFIFHNKESIRNSLIPLISLFKICPITTVNDVVINRAFNKTILPSDSFVVEYRNKPLKDEGSISSNFSLQQRIDTIDARILASTDESDIKKLEALRQLLMQQQNLYNAAYPSKQELEQEERLIKHMDRSLEASSVPDEPSLFVPVALTALTLATHPSIPGGIIASLTMNRITVSPYSNGPLQWRDEYNNPTNNPSKAFYLKLALLKHIEKISVDLENIVDSFGFKIEYIASSKDITIDLDKYNVDDKVAKIDHISASIRNYFSFPTIIGSEYPCAQHLGRSNIALNLNVTSNNINFYNDINAVKRNIDRVIRSEFYEERFYGFKVRNLLADLLGAEKFYFSYINTATDENSNEVLNISFGLSESRFDLIKDQVITVTSNKYSYTDLKKLWDRLIELSREALIEASKDGRPIHDVIYEQISDPNTTQTNLKARALLLLVGYQYNQGIPRRELNVPTYASFGNSFGIITPDLIMDTLTNNQGVFNFEVFRKHYYALYDAIIPPDTPAPLIQQFLASAFHILINTGPVGLTVQEKLGVNDGIINSIKTDLFSGVLEAVVPPADNAASTKIAKALYLYNNNPAGELRDILFTFIRSGIWFDKKFADRMFDVLYYRHNEWILFKTAGSIDKNLIEASKRLFLQEFEENAHHYLNDAPGLINFRPQLRNRKIVNNILEEIDLKGDSNYSDFDLPTYQDLFGIGWPAFALTWADIGKQAPTKRDDAFASSPDANNIDKQSLPVCTGDDKIDPSAFFYSGPRDKDNELADAFDKEYERSLNDNLDKFYIGLNYDLKEIINVVAVTDSSTFAGKFGTYFNDVNSRTKASEAKLKTALANIWNELPVETKQKLFDKKSDPNTTDKDFHDLLYDSNGYLKYTKGAAVPATVNGQSVPRKKSHLLALGINYGGSVQPNYVETTSLVSSRILRAGLQVFPDLFAEYITSSIDTNREFGLPRISSDNKLVSDYNAVLREKAKNGTTDLRYNPIRAFPVARFYLLDEEDKKYYFSDVFTGINSIISIDITTDKHDPPLAKVIIADPLRILQNQIFDNNEDASDVMVLDEDTNQASYKNKKNTLKIKIGRPVQIRMGYGGNPETLDVVFNGRITEIVPGDVITLIAQGWKAECFSNETSLLLNQFLRNDQSSVRDLVTSVIRSSEMNGLGSVFTPQEKDLLNNSNDLATDNKLSHSQLTNVTPIGFNEFFFPQYSLGLDTRIANVWCPDIKATRLLTPANLLQPQNIGREWIIPMQPVWDTLQEGTRHCFGYICDVVPYETRGTIFFGRPDQLYYAREVDRRTIAKWQKQVNQNQTSLFNELEKIISQFLASTFYDDPNAEIAEGEITFNIIDGPLRAYLESWNGRSKYRPYITGRNAGQPTSWDHVIKYKNASYLRSLFMIRSNNKGFLNGIAQEQRLPNNDLVSLLSDNGVTSYLDFRSKDADRVSQIDSSFGSGSAAWQLAVRDAQSEFDYILDTFGDDFVNILFELALNVSAENTNTFDINKRAIFRVISAPWFSPGDPADGNQLFKTMQPIVSQELAQDLSSFSLADVGAGSASLQEKIKSYNQRIANYIKLAAQSNSLILIGKEDFQDSVVLDYNTFAQGELYSNDLNAVSSNQTLYLVNRNLSYSKKTFSELALDERSLIVSFFQQGSPKYGYVLDKKLRNSILSLNREMKSLTSKTGTSSETNTLRQKFRKDLRFKFSITGEEEARSRNDGSTKPITKNPDNLTLKDFIDSEAISIKLFIIFFAKFLQESAATNKDINVAAVKKAMNNYKHSSLAPNMDIFRKYHNVSSQNDIISNDIFATTKEMNNSVIIQYPHEISTDNFNVNTENGIIPVFSSAPRYWPDQSLFGEAGLSFSPGLSKAIKKVKMFSEMNVENEDRAAVVACTRLANEMKSMYRGSLTILGRSMKPHDIILLDDKYTDMRGPVEIERVTHHFSPEDGWTTTIVPHALVMPNPGTEVLEIAKKQTTLSFYLDAAGTALNVLVLGYFLSAGTSSAFGKGLFASSGTVLKTGITKAIWPLIRRTLTLGIVGGADSTTAGPTTSLKTKLASAGTAISNRWSVITNVVPEAFGRSLSTYLLGHTALEIAHGVHNITTTQEMRTHMNAGTNSLLPVTVTPLLLYERPFTAGLETSAIYYHNLGTKAVLGNHKIESVYDHILSYGEIGPINRDIVRP